MDPALAIEGCDPVAKPVAKPTPHVLDSGVLFKFDSAEVLVTGREVLDRVAATIKPGSTVLVVGHTDRIGSADYNKGLSDRRAQAVAKYLASKVQATYQASGVGSTQPSGKTEMCRGQTGQALISCLMPDRRVVITVIK